MSSKKILFISPEFFDFHLQIRQALEAKGHQVFFVPDRPSTRAWIKIIIRKARFLITPWLNAYYRRRFAAIPVDIDEVFMIRGEGIPPQALRFMRQRFVKARFQLYLWDAIKRSPEVKKIFSFMDRVWTYDANDAQNHPGLKLTANFFVPSPNGLHAPESDFAWDLAFFGTAHGDRLKVIKKISESLPADIRFYRFFYFQSPIMYYARKIADRAMAYFKPNELGLKPKFGREWEDVVRQTSTILDVHHPDQGGLTIRAIESLAMGFKLVTTDASIKKYPFYDPERIRVIDRENPILDARFLRQPNRASSPSAFKELELPQWLEKIIDG